MKLSNIFTKRGNSLETKDNPIGALLYQTGMYRGTFLELRDYVNLGLCKNPTVNQVVTKIAGSASSVPIKLKRKTGDTVTEIKEHPVLDLINKPNPMETKQQFLQLFFTSRLIVGNAFILAAQASPSSAPIELWNSDFRAWKIKPGKSGVPESYQYQGSRGQMEFQVNQFTGDSQVYHSKNINMQDPLFGESPLISGRVWLDVSNQGAEWNASMLQNGARPSGAMKIAGTLTDEQYGQLKERMDSSYSGVRNSGKQLLLEGGMDWVQMSQTAKDMDFLASLNYSDKMICGIYGYPYILMSEDSSTYNNVETARSILWEDTITPFLDGSLESLGFWLLPKFKLDAAPKDQEGYYFEADYSKLPAYESKQSAKTERIMGMFTAGLLTINETRKELGYDESDNEGADELYIPSTMIPLDDDAKQVDDALAGTQGMFGQDPNKPNPDDDLSGDNPGKPNDPQNRQPNKKPATPARSGKRPQSA